MEDLLQLLHDCEINGSVEWFYDGSWRVRIGDLLNGWKAEATVDTAAAAIAWLDGMARDLYPHYARRRAH